MLRFNLLLMSVLTTCFVFGQGNSPRIELYVNQKLWQETQPIPLKDKPKIAIKVTDEKGSHFAIDKIEIWSAEADTLPLDQEGSIKVMKKDASRDLYLPLPLALKAGSLAEYRINQLYRKEGNAAAEPIENSTKVVKVRFE